MPMDGDTVWLGEGGGAHGLCADDAGLGRVPFDGPDAGLCVTGGGRHAGEFHMLLATAATPEAAGGGGGGSSLSFDELGTRFAALHVT